MARFKVGDIVIRTEPPRSIPIMVGDICEVMYVTENGPYDTLTLFNFRTGGTDTAFSSHFFKKSEEHVVDKILTKYSDE